MKKSNLIKGYIYTVLSAIIFGLMPLMAKYIYMDGVNPESLILLRNIVSIPFLFVLALLSGNSVRVKPSAFPHISFIAFMGCCATPFLLFSSYNYIQSGTATVFHFIYPAVVVICEYIFLKNKLSFGHIISVVLCAAGIVLFYDKNSTINFTGSLFALLSGVTYAIYVLSLSTFKHKEISGFSLNFYIGIISSVFMLIMCLLTDNLALPQTPTGWLLIALFGISINVGAIVLFQKGTFLIGGGRASVLSTLEPVTGVITGAIVFGERLSLLTVIGTILVITASALIALSDAKGENCKG